MMLKLTTSSAQWVRTIELSKQRLQIYSLVKAKIRLSLMTAKTARKIRYNWKRFASSLEIQERYTVEVKNRYQALEEDDDNGACYAKFVEANQQAMEECIPLKPKRKSIRT